MFGKNECLLRFLAGSGPGFSAQWNETEASTGKTSFQKIKRGGRREEGSGRWEEGGGKREVGGGRREEGRRRREAGGGRSRVSFETSFDSKQPKVEPKLVSALSETKRLFRLFRINTETESFDVSIETKKTDDQPKQFDRDHILVFFYRKFRVFPVLSVLFFFFGLLLNSLFRLFLFYIKTESFDVSIEPKQTEDQPKQFEREHVWVFFRKFWVDSVCFGCFDLGSKNRNKPIFFAFGFTKQTETDCAADFSLLNLPKGKSLGRSKPATNS
jgi:hypothetical protein